MRAGLAATVLLAGCVRATPLPPPLPSQKAADIASGLRVGAALVPFVEAIPGVPVTLETCIAGTVLVAGLASAAEAIDAAAGPLPEIPAVAVDLTACSEFGDVSIPLKDADAAEIREAIAALTALTGAVLNLSRVRERDCVGYEIGAGVLDWLSSAAQDLVVSDGVYTFPARPLHYASCGQ